MIALKRFINFLLFGNVFVALGAFCLVQSTVIQLNFNDHLLSYSLLIFFSTLFIYNLQRIFYKPQSDSSLHSIRRKWIFENQTILKTLCFMGFAGTVITFFFCDPRIIFYLAPLFFLSIAYFIPFIKLRKNAWFKLFTLVTVWTITTAIIPLLLNSTDTFTKNDLLHIFVRLTFMLAICIPFDIRDLKIDKADTISTLPQLLGEDKTRWLAGICMVIYCLLIVLEFQWKLVSKHIFIGLISSALVNAILVVMSNSKRNEYFYVAALDGTMILQGIVLLVFNHS